MKSPPLDLGRGASGDARRAAPALALALALAPAWLVGCAPVPKPAVLDQVEAVRATATVEQARRLAPAAYAHAEKLRAGARKAADEGDAAAAQLLSERALAAYAHAHAVARAVRAGKTARESEARARELEIELASLEAEQRRAQAEIDAAETRIRITRDLEASGPGAGDPARERARLASARALALEARLLCAAAGLLLAEGRAPGAAPTAPTAPTAPGAAVSPGPPEELEAARALLSGLEADLAGKPARAPIDRAARARATCLSVLTRVRRSKTPVSRAPGAGDALLAELSAVGGLSPSRDDRGVVVTLRGLSRGEKLSPEAERKLRELGRVAAAHPAFPVAVVVHAAGAGEGRAGASPDREGALAADALRAGGAKRALVIDAGSARPLVDPAGRDGARNARVEIVFVSPEAD